MQFVVGLLLSASAFYVTARISLWKMARKINENARQLAIERRRIEWLLITTGDLINNAGLKDRYNADLLRMLLLKDEGTPVNNPSILE